MTKKSQPKASDGDANERLAKLSADWNESRVSSSEFNAADLRMMLEGHAPLWDLIRSIVADTSKPTGFVPGGTTATEMSNSSGDIQALQKDLETAKQQLHNSAIEIESSLGKIQELEEKNKVLISERLALTSQLLQCKADLLRAQSLYSDTPALTLLRADQQLAKNMGLSDLSDDDVKALIQIVAVLSQRDNVKRLWETLRDRCESEKRPAADDEIALLHSALAWHNHNWSTLPYRLIETAPGNRYDYKIHLRSRHVTKGETIVAMYLPGIQDGAGDALSKTLVMTN